MKTTILQPTYLPWLGYFEMIDAAEQYIVFDHVQFEPKSWQQRNRIKGPNGEVMLTVPVLSDGTQDIAIKDKRIAHNHPWVKKHLKSLISAYQKAPYFDQYFPYIRDILEQRHARLADMTLSLITLFSELLGIETRVRRSSEILREDDSHLDKTERVVHLCKAADATALYDGAAAADFLNLERFREQGIDIAFQHYAHPTYPQQWEGFAPYMGVVDLLFNCGPDSLGIIRKGVS